MECFGQCNGERELLRRFWTLAYVFQLDSDIIELLSQNLARLDEDNDADRAGVYHILGMSNSSQPFSTRPA